MLASLMRIGPLGLGTYLIVVGIAAPVYGVPPPHAPEIDPSSMMGALALLAGGMLVITDRLVRKNDLPA